MPGVQVPVLAYPQTSPRAGFSSFQPSLLFCPTGASYESYLSRSLGCLCQIYWNFRTSTDILQKRPVDSLIHQYLRVHKSIAATSMDKAEIIKILQSEDWTKADAIRAVASIDFSTSPDELNIRRNISSRFAGRELIERQNAQKAQKGVVTRKNNQIELLKREYQADIKQRDLQIARSKQQVIGADSPEQAQQIELMQQQYRLVIEQHDNQNQQLLARVKELEVDNRSLAKVNAELKKDNKSLKNIVDSIRLQIARDMKGILKNPDSDLRQAILKLFKSTQG